MDATATMGPTKAVLGGRAGAEMSLSPAGVDRVTFPRPRGRKLVGVQGAGNVDTSFGTSSVAGSFCIRMDIDEVLLRLGEDVFAEYTGGLNGMKTHSRSFCNQTWTGLTGTSVPSIR